MQDRIGVQGFRGSKVPFLSLDYIGNAHLRQKHQPCQACSKIWSQIGNYLGKKAFMRGLWAFNAFFVLNLER